MRRKLMPLLLASCLLLTGCSLLDRQYSTVEEHTSKYWDSDSADTLRAESYQDIVNDLLLLIGQHTERATLRFYNSDIEPMVTDLLEQATTEVQHETAMGSYAVEYMTSEIKQQHSFDEITLHISYRRSEEQIQSIVNATTTAALSDLLDTTIQSGKKDLTVRIGYWDSSDARKVEQTVAAARRRWGLADQPDWTVSYYPSRANPGLIEFIMTDSAQ